MNRLVIANFAELMLGLPLLDKWITNGGWLLISIRIFNRSSQWRTKAPRGASVDLQHPRILYRIYSRWRNYVPSPVCASSGGVQLKHFSSHSRELQIKSGAGTKQVLAIRCNFINLKRVETVSTAASRGAIILYIKNNVAAAAATSYNYSIHMSFTCTTSTNSRDLCRRVGSLHSGYTDRRADEAAT